MNRKVHSRDYGSARQQERERVRKFINDIKNDLAGAPFFLNLFGPRGFGKTAFLEWIWDTYERTMPTSLIRVGEFCKEDDETLALDELLIHIIDQLGERLPRRVASLPSDFKNWTNEKQLTELLLNLVSGAKDTERVTLLLIDDYDSIPEEQRHLFQEDFLSPASRTGKFAALLTSETELRFTQSFELRIRLECRELTGLDPQAISRAWSEYEEIAGKIHRITGGLPVFTKELIDQLQDSQVKTSADFQAHAQELTGKYYRAYVEDRVLADLSPDIRETVLVLALLRRFDIKVLKKMLPDLLPEVYQSYGTADYLDLIDHLRPWVEWRRQGGYALNSAFRLMLQGYVLTIKPDLFKRVNRAAEVMYRGWLENEYHEYSLAELLYHVLVLYRAETNGLFPMHDEMSQAKVGDELLRYLAGDSGQRVQETDLDSLRNSLEQDPDLKYCISEKVKDSIQALIDRKIKAEAQKKIIVLSSKTG